jgi:hypothetical protein
MIDDTVTTASNLPAIVAPDPLAGAPTIEELKRKYDAFRNATQASALLQQRDRDYYDGPKQLNSDVRAVLKMREQPAIYTNRVRPAIDGVLGLLNQQQTDPRAYPRNPDEDNAADVATKALRFISDSNRFKEVKLDCAEEYQIEGLCAAIIEIGGDGTDIIVTQIPWKDFFYDPRSRRPDFKDALYMGAAKWMYADDVKLLYPERYAAMGDPVSGAISAGDGLRDDKPDNVTAWVDQKMRRLMVVEIYYRMGSEWYRCVFCAAGVFEFGVSPYQDDKQRSICPIEAVSCYVDRDLNRYGRVRDMIPIQDEINARRSRLLHLANTRQIQEREMGAAIVDADTARLEASKADGVIPSGWMMVPTADLAAGQQLLLVESKSEIERMGPTPAVLGRQGDADQSGRARLVLQQAGMTELARPLGRHEDWETRVYGQQWWRAKQFWTDPKWIRVTDDARSPMFIQMNAPQQPGPDGTVETDPQTGTPKRKNDIASMDMDIIVETVPDTANLQQEVWTDLMDLMKIFPPDDPRFTIAVEMSPIADKQRILERIKAFKDEQAQSAQGQQQAAQAQQQAENATAQAKAMLTAAQADFQTSQSEALKTQTFATFGPVAAAFGIAPSQEGVAAMQTAVHPANAPPPTPGTTPFVAQPDHDQAMARAAAITAAQPPAPPQKPAS